MHTRLLLGDGVSQTHLVINSQHYFCDCLRNLQTNEQVAVHSRRFRSPLCSITAHCKRCADSKLLSFLSAT